MEFVIPPKKEREDFAWWRRIGKEKEEIMHMGLFMSSLVVSCCSSNEASLFFS